MLKAELKTSEIKKELKAFKVIQRYHNKNKSGGNFALEIRFNEEFKRGVDMEINGSYSVDGSLIHLNLGELWGSGGYPLIPFENLKSLSVLLEYLKTEIPERQKINKMMGEI